MAAHRAERMTREQGEHVRCVQCGEVWPCQGARDDAPSDAESRLAAIAVELERAQDWTDQDAVRDALFAISQLVED